jgi:hypothetical protein
MPENIIERHDVNAEKAAIANASTFLGRQDQDFGIQETPIYFYNTSALEFNQSRPPNHPHMLIRACPKGQPYIMARGSISHPFTEQRADQNDNKYAVLTNGFKEATKMVNPMNPCVYGDERDQDHNLDSEFHQGDNLGKFGVFWSRNNPPLAEEVEKAQKRMETSYRKELERMGKAKTADEALGMRNNISAAAADYFGVSATWHQTDLISRDYGKVECGVCGEKIQPTAKLCIHCKAPTDEKKQAAWLDAQTSPKLAQGARA